MKAHYLGHIVFYVSDLETSVSFYEEILGWQRIKSNSLPFKAAALTSGRTHHELLLIEVGSAPKPPTGQRLGLYHIGIKVGDSLEELTDVKRELTDLGISISGISDHTISQSIYISDPDGNEVELYVDDPNIDWKNEPNLVMSPIKPLFLRD